MKKVFATLCILAICGILLLPSVNAYSLSDTHFGNPNPPPYSPYHPANAPIYRAIQEDFERTIRPYGRPQFDEPTNDLQRVLQNLQKQVEKLIEWLKEGKEKEETIGTVFAIAGLLAVVYLIKRRRNKRINKRLKKNEKYEKEK